MKYPLRKVILDIRKGEYLTEALARHGKTNIPTHVILNKMLPGLGATHAELIASRSSVIIEPNVPAIVKKEEKHPHIFGVYKGRSVEQIINYLQRHKHRRKLVSTPEGFAKIKTACEEAGINLFEEFFLLFDECEKITQDIDYREAIYLPMNDFFRFRQCAFVSATPLLLSDPRFYEKGFTELVIRPDYEYRKPLRLITTNNVILTLSDLLKSIRRQTFVFVNSIDTIDSIFKVDIDTAKTATFCSEQGLEKLCDRKYRKAYTEIKKTERLNFLTGRFYSAVDIDLNEKPDVILLSDLYGAEQSVIDPYTEAVQIAGRFRNGINSIVHISSIRPDLECLSEEEAENWLEGAERVYKELYSRSRTAKNKGEKAMLSEAVSILSFAQYMETADKRNFFKTDNFIRHEKIKNLYRSAESLFGAYKEVSYFETVHENRVYDVDDNDRLALQRLKTMKSRRIFLLNQFEKLQPLRFSSDPSRRERYQRSIRHLLNGKDDLCFYECFEQKGAAFIREINFNSAKIKKAVEETSAYLWNMESEIKAMVRKSFRPGETYSRSDISAMLSAIYRKANKPFNKRVNATDIKKYIEVEEINKRTERIYRIC